MRRASEIAQELVEAWHEDKRHDVNLWNYPRSKELLEAAVSAAIRQAQLDMIERAARVAAAVDVGHGAVDVRWTEYRDGDVVQNEIVAAIRALAEEVKG